MGRTRNPEVAKRNDVLFAEWRRGASLTDLGERYSLSRQVVGRIVAAFHPEEGEDDDRALYRGYMWRLFEEVQQIGDHPGFKMRPDGRPATGLDGEPAADTNVQVQAKELQLKIIRELRLLDGRDRQRQAQTPYDLAMQQMQAAISEARAKVEADAADRRELEELRQWRAGVVQGTAERVRELPPGAPPPGNAG